MGEWVVQNPWGKVGRESKGGGRGNLICVANNDALGEIQLWVWKMCQKRSPEPLGARDLRIAQFACHLSILQFCSKI